MTPPEDVRLPLHSERTRVLAAAATGDTVILERSLKDLAGSVNPLLDEIAERMRTPAAAADPELMASLRHRAALVASELVVARLVADTPDDAALRDIKQVQGLFQGAARSQLDIIDALIVLREGRVDEATALFKPLSEVSTLGAVGYGLSLEAAGRADEAAEIFKRAALFSPVSPIGVYARTRYERIKGEELVYSDDAQAVRAVAQAVPEWFDRAAGNPARLMSFTVGFENQVIDPYEKPSVMLNIRNVSPIALAIGSDRPINSRLMMSPSLSIGSFVATSVLTAEVLDMHRKIRLVPGESLSLEIWPDAGSSGWIAELKSAHLLRSRWNLLQGFVVGQGKLYDAGPMCLSIETPLLTRRPDPRVRSSLADLARELEVYEEERLIALLPTIRAALVDPDRPVGRPTAAEVSRIANVLAARYPVLSRRGRLAVTAIAPHSVLRPGMEPLDAAILAETDPVVLAVGIFSRARLSTDSALIRAAASDNAGLAKLAKNLRLRLEGQSPAGFAFMPAVGSHKPAAPEHREAISP